jgi:O-antigen/teichoic acid export membrane protein
MTSQHSESERGPAGLAGGRAGVLRRMITNGGMLLGGGAVEALLGIATVALTIRAIGMNGFGALILIQTVAATAGQMLNLQLGPTVVTFGSPRLHDNDRSGLSKLVAFLVRLEFAASALAIVVTATAIFWLGPIIDLPSQALLPAAAYMVVIAFQTRGRTANGLLRLFQRFDRIALLRGAQSLVQLLGTAGLWLLGYGELIGFLAVWFAGIAVRGIGSALGAYAELRRHHCLPATLQHGQRASALGDGLWRFIGMTNLKGLLSLPGDQIGTLLAGGLFGAGAAGLLQLASRIARAMSHPVRSMRPAIGPELAQLLAAGEHRRLRRLVLRATGLAGAGAVIGFPLLALAGLPLLELMGGNKAADAYLLMLLLAIARFLSLTAFPLSPLLNAAARPGWMTSATAVGTAINVGAFIALATPLGLESAGVAGIIAVLARVAIELAGALPLLRSRTDG